MTISFNNGSNCSCNNSGIKSMKISTDGHLIVTYADNTIEDLGLVVGHDGSDGSNFYPNEIGFEIPDSDFNTDKTIGWSYLSLANSTSVLYFKTSNPGESSTWNSVEFGKGEQGEQGKPFHIDSSGTVFPTSGLFDGYTFYNTNDGKLYFYDSSTQTWSSGISFRGEVGSRGRFHIDSTGSTFPDITNLPEDYCFYNTSDGKLYYVDIVENTDPVQKEWSTGIEFRGKEGLQGEKGDKGDAGKDIVVIVNTIDHSYTNTVLVIGTCPAGYLVTNIEVNVTQGYEPPVTDMKIRFSGEANEDIGGTVIAGYDYFDISMQSRYVINETNHIVSDKDEIISCIFNESVNLSSYGNMTIICTLSWQAPTLPISDNI